MRATVVGCLKRQTTVQSSPPPPRGQCFTTVHGIFHANRIGGLVLALFSLRNKTVFGTHITHPSRYNVWSRGQGGGQSFTSRRVHPDVRFNTYAVSDTHGFQERCVSGVKRNARFDVQVPYATVSGDATYALRVHAYNTRLYGERGGGEGAIHGADGKRTRRERIRSRCRRDTA